MKGKKTGRPLLPQALCALALCFTMLIFAPVEMVMINSTNFWFGVSDFLPAFALLFALAFAVVQAVCLLLRKLPYALYMLAQGLLFGVMLCVYMQGNYLCMGNEILTTGDPLWRGMLGAMMINTAVWAAVMLGSVCFALLRPKAFMKAVCAASALVMLMEGAAMASLMMGNTYSSDLNRVYCSDEEQFTFSPNGDVIMVMLDTFDTRLMDRALEEEPDYADVFEDFTYYRNTSSSTSLTDTSFMSFMTGEVADNSEPFFLYCRRAMRESAFFPAMKEAGMTVQVYAAPNGVFSEEQMQDVDNLRVRDSHIGSYAAFAKEMLCMIGYRYLPMAMQPFLLRNYAKGFDQLQEMESDGLRASTDSNPAFIKKLQKEGVTIDEGRRFFKFFLLHGAHKPIEMDRHMQENEQADQYDQLLGCFAMLGEFFAQLEREGIYDEATVIVFGDHGVNDDWRRGICNPAMLVKYPHETGPMRTSDAPVQLLDLRATALHGAGIDHSAVGTPACLWEGVEQRDRTLMTYQYDVPSSYKFYLNKMTEYTVPKDATDLDAYAPSGRVFERAN